MSIAGIWNIRLGELQYRCQFGRILTPSIRARIAKADGDAKAIQVEAQAIRTNPEIVKMRAVEKWNGQLPTYSGPGPMPFIGVQ